MYPVVIKYAANCGIGSVAVAEELTTCPVALPTLIFEELVLEVPCGADRGM